MGDMDQVLRRQLEMLREQLQEMWDILQPENPDRYRVFSIGDKVICGTALLDNQTRQGEEILESCMAPCSATMAEFGDSVLRCLKYRLLELEAERRNNFYLRKKLWQYRDWIDGDGENWKDGCDLNDSD